MTKKIFFLSLIFLICGVNAFATHIIGGNLQLVHLQGINYKLQLTLYFDCLNGNTGAKDNNVEVSAFGKSDNLLITSFDLPLMEENRISYLNAACVSGQGCVDELNYYTTIQLNPNEFNDSVGYYFSWERCCRNHIIENITTPGDVGMTFYMEFPPLNVQNTSPVFSKGLGEFLCIGVPFIFNFEGIDSDGDQLKYSFITPIIGNSASFDVKPLSRPGPYAKANWSSGYSLDSILPSLPVFSVDNDLGDMQITPTKEGVFVFALLCEEFRDSVKIGEVVFEYQITVVTCSGTGPVLNAKIPDIDATTQLTVGKFTCFDIFSNDIDPNEKLSLNAKGSGFNLLDLGAVFNNISQNSNGITDTVKSLFCWQPNCAALQEDNYYVDFSVSDLSCPSPRIANMTLAFNVNEEPDNPPEVWIENLGSLGTVIFTAGKDTCLNILGTDPDLADSLSIKIFSPYFNPGDKGMTLFTSPLSPGSLNGSLCWTPPCSMISDSLHPIYLEIFDNTFNCTVSRDTFLFYVQVKSDAFIDPHLNVIPEIPAAISDTISVDAGDLIQFNVEGYDLQNDSLLTLSLFPENFDIGLVNLQFDSLSGKGDAGKLVAPFNWKTRCEEVRESYYILDFILRSSNERSCPLNATISRRLFIEILPVPDIDAAPLQCIERVSKDALQLSWDDTLSKATQVQYSIYRSDDDSDFALIWSGEILTGSYVDLTALNNDSINYCYQIGVINNCERMGKLSFSQCAIKEPNPTYLANVSVLPNKNILVSWESWDDASFTQYHIFRKLRSKGGYEEVKVISDAQQTSWEDDSVDTDNESYCYQIRINNICGKLGKASNEGCTIFLRGKAHSFYNSIRWLPYTFWQDSVKEYQVFRADERDEVFRNIMTVPSESLEQEDNNLKRNSGRYFYRIDGIERNSKETISQSNIIELKQKPVVYPPSAFTPANPDGVNDFFVITHSFVKDYHLQIFDRWGLLLFETEDMSVHWDGTYKGVVVPLDAYIYLLFGTGHSGERIYRKGSVTVIR